MSNSQKIDFEDAVQVTTSILTEDVPNFLDLFLFEIASGKWERLIEPLRKDPENELTLNVVRLALIVAVRGDMEIPKTVYPYLEKILVDAPKQRNRPAGRPRQDGNLGIALALRALQSRGMRPTRNDASPPLSGCDAVAEAQRRLGRIPNTYDAVRAIWRIERKNPYRGK